jgi:biopolymer transport protein ExbD
VGASLGSNDTIAEINMTPLIDIVLVVLIIMMVNIPIQVEEMGLKLPSMTPPTTPPDPSSENLVIALYADGKVGLNLRLMNDEVLFFEVTRRLLPMSKKIVFIDAHPDVLYSRVIDAMDMAREAGAETVAFAKLKETGPADATSVAPGAVPRGVMLGSPGVAGAMTEKQAHEQFQPMMGVASSCYATRLAAVPDLTGRLIVRVDVGPQGEIMETGLVEAGSTIADPELAACILDRLSSTLSYEALGEQNTARIHYPLLFSPG